MNTDTACRGCGEPFDWDEGECPACGWDSERTARTRHGLGTDGHGEPEEDGSAGGGGFGGLGPIR